MKRKNHNMKGIENKKQKKRYREVYSIVGYQWIHDEYEVYKMTLICVLQIGKFNDN